MDSFNSAVLCKFLCWSQNWKYGWRLESLYKFEIFHLTTLLESQQAPLTLHPVFFTHLRRVESGHVQLSISDHKSALGSAASVLLSASNLLSIVIVLTFFGFCQASKGKSLIPTAQEVCTPLCSGTRIFPSVMYFFH